MNVKRYLESYNSEFQGVITIVQFERKGFVDVNCLIG